ncbi:hypothetical protein [Flaviaesturariibacter amylovorans]|uniref:hypothetical protein n=1 Tax=Flaviaesturariibacter amylovorans TaxID=1084520 RepID=UPI0031EE698C
MKPTSAKTKAVLLLLCFTHLNLSGLSQPCPGISDKAPDPTVDRVALLSQLSDIIRAYAESASPEVDNMGNISNFFVFDLSDSSNRQYPENFSRSPNSSVKFIDKHFYHFAYIYKSSSVSHILFVEGNRIKVFYAVNCPWGPQNIDSVHQFASARLAALPYRDGLLQRIQAYRKFGYYRAICGTESVRCGSKPGKRQAPFSL